MNSLQRDILVVALKNFFRVDGYFSICDLETMCKANGIVLPRATHDALHQLHCVHWSEMPDHVRRYVYNTVCELLSGQPSFPEIVAPTLIEEANAHINKVKGYLS